MLKAVGWVVMQWSGIRMTMLAANLRIISCIDCSIVHQDTLLGVVEVQSVCVSQQSD